MKTIWWTHQRLKKEPIDRMQVCYHWNKDSVKMLSWFCSQDNIKVFNCQAWHFLNSLILTNPDLYWGKRPKFLFQSDYLLWLSIIIRTLKSFIWLKLKFCCIYLYPICLLFVFVYFKNLNFYFESFQTCPT